MTSGYHMTYDSTYAVLTYAPEPASLVLLLAGAGTLGLRRRR